MELYVDVYRVVPENLKEWIHSAPRREDSIEVSEGRVVWLHDLYPESIPKLVETGATSVSGDSM